MLHYDLQRVKAAITQDRLVIERKDSLRYRELGLTRDDVIRYLTGLREGDWHKAHHYGDGCVDDGYRVVEHDRWGQKVVYIKLRLVTNGDGDTVVLISFHLSS